MRRNATMQEDLQVLSDYQGALRKMGGDPEPLARQAEALAALSAADFERALKVFHAAADGQPGVFDSDYGALLLEALGDDCKDPERKARLYDQALLRASIFNSYATSGSEGLARGIDVRRISQKIEDLDPGNGK